MTYEFKMRYLTFPTDEKVEKKSKESSKMTSWFHSFALRGHKTIKPACQGASSHSGEHFLPHIPLLLPPSPSLPPFLSLP